MDTICSNLNGHPDIEARYESIREIIKRTAAPIYLVAINRNFNSFIATHEDRLCVFTYGNTFSNKPHWDSDIGGIRMECTIDQIYPNFVRV
ncbi:hypothetical protein [Pontibacillus halophilus]|uniref:hypothetical protein n=1 Tax=Pontibacillus halophilus TaxID=516704 RepID=UPI00047C7696|nr:hypothetical protein [Pontibacillus halophilus]